MKKMTPKEKADKLINEMQSQRDMPLGASIQCGLIAVDEILEATKKYIAVRERVEYSKTGFDNVVHTVYDEYWKDVKSYIKSL